MAIFSFRSDKDSRGAVLNPSVETGFKLHLQSLHGTYCAVVGDYINTMKTTFDFNFDFYRKKLVK